MASIPGIVSLLGGIGTSLFGGLLGSNAADMARKRLIAAANMPGLDVNKVTAESLGGALAALPQAGRAVTDINKLNAAQLAAMLETGIPGYGAGVGRTMGRIQDYLSGVLPEDVTKAVMRSTAGTAIGRGYGAGSPLGRALTWRDLGRTSEEGIRYGMQTMMQLPSALPWQRPVDVQGWLGPTPLQLAGIRGQERAAQQALLAQAAGMPGASAIWGNLLGQLGGMGMGYGLQTLMQPKPVDQLGQFKSALQLAKLLQF